MKIKNIVIVLCLIGLVAGSCTKDYLKENPESFITDQNLYTSSAGALSALNAAYASLKNFRNSGRTMLIGVVGTDEGQLGIDEAGVSDRLGLDAYDGNLNATNPHVIKMWSNIYLGIGRANSVLQNTPAIAMDASLKNRIIGEASFLRALNYFWAVQLWGDIPIITTVINDAGTYNYPRKPTADVYKLIISDLQTAINNLPDTYSGNDIGRATKGAANALLAKVYLSAPGNLRDYAKVVQYCQAVLNSPANYQLMANYSDVFDVTKENNSESVFEVQFTSPDQPNNMSYCTGSRALPDNILGGGYAWFIPTDSLYNAFSANDKRKPVTFRTQFFDANGNQVTSDPNPEHLKPHVKKFEDPSANPSSLDGKNCYVIRLADVILMYGEALNETGQTAAAETQLNRIRTRAGVPTYSGSGQSTLRDLILRERALELCFEGWRWYDLKRTGKLVEYAKKWNPRARANIKESNNLYPIPNSELVGNSGIGTSGQNPGY